MLLVELVAIMGVVIFVTALATLVWGSSITWSQKREEKKNKRRVDGTKMQYGEQGDSENLRYIRGR